MKTKIEIKPYFIYPFLKSWKTTYVIEDGRIHVKKKWGKGSDSAILKDAEIIPDSRFKLIKSLIKYGNIEVIGQSGKSTLLQNLGNIDEIQKLLLKLSNGMTVEQITMTASDRKSKDRKEKLLNTNFSDKVVLIPSIPKQLDRPLWMHIAQIKNFPTKYFEVGDWINEGDVIAIFTDWFIDENLSIKSPISGRLLCYHDPFHGGDTNGYIAIQPENDFVLEDTIKPYSEFIKLLRNPKIYEHYFRNSKLNLKDPNLDFNPYINELEKRKCTIEEPRNYQDIIDRLNREIRQER